MPKADGKKESPLQEAIKEGDEFKKEVTNFVNEGQEALKEKEVEKSASQIRNLYKKSKDLVSNYDQLIKAAEALDKENEPSKVMRFDSKKKDEIKRLTKLKEKLDESIKKMALNDVEEDYLQKASTGEVKAEESEYEDEEEEEGEEEEEWEEGEEEMEEESEEEEEGDEDSGEEEEEEEEGEEEEEEEADTDMQTTGTMRQYEALESFDGQQAGDLGFEKGDILTVLFAREDGWLEAKDSKGKTGLVPSTYLKVYSNYNDVQESEDEDEEEDDENDPKTPRSGRLLWKNIKKAVKETSVTDVLQAMGAVPAGFRDSTLGKLAVRDEYKTKSYLAPKLSSSCVAYRDLFYDTDKIRSLNARVQRIVGVVACRQIPLPGAGIEVTSRHVRVCLFDGKNVLSNIHTIRIQSMDKEQRTWNFNSKASESMKSVEFSEFFVRSNSTEGNIGILIELGMTYVRQTTNQEGEFSCGWVHLPLFDENGAPAPNKTYDLFVNGGTPYEKGVDVDPSVGRRASTNPFRSLMSGNRQPRLIVRIQVPTKDQKDLLDTLPSVLVSSTAYIQYISFYRQLLADALIGDCVEPESTDLIHNVLLATFPSIADQPDMMDVLRTAWAERLKTAKRSEKRDQEAIKKLFQGVFMDTAYPLCHCATIPSPKFGDHKNEQDRWAEIQRLLNISKDKKAAVAMLLSSDAVYSPFDVSEVSFGVIGPYCLAR